MKIYSNKICVTDSQVKCPAENEVIQAIVKVLLDKSQDIDENTLIKKDEIRAIYINIEKIIEILKETSKQNQLNCQFKSKISLN